MAEKSQAHGYPEDYSFDSRLARRSTGVRGDADGKQVVVSTSVGCIYSPTWVGVG